MELSYACIKNSEDYFLQDEMFLERITLIYKSLGKVCEVRYKYSEAWEYYIKSLNFHKKLAEEEDDYDLSDDYINLGNVCFKQNRLSEAENYYNLSYGIESRLEEKTGLPLNKSRLANVYLRLGEVAYAKDDIYMAITCYEEAVDIREEIAEKTYTIKDRKDLITDGYAKLIDLHLDLKHYADATDYCKRALPVAQALINDTGDEEFQKLYDDISRILNILTGSVN